MPINVVSSSQDPIATAANEQQAIEQKIKPKLRLIEEEKKEEELTNVAGVVEELTPQMKQLLNRYKVEGRISEASSENSDNDYDDEHEIDFN